MNAHYKKFTVCFHFISLLHHKLTKKSHQILRHNTTKGLRINVCPSTKLMTEHHKKKQLTPCFKWQHNLFAQIPAGGNSEYNMTAKQRRWWHIEFSVSCKSKIKHRIPCFIFSYPAWLRMHITITIVCRVKSIHGHPPLSYYLSYIHIWHATISSPNFSVSSQRDRSISLIHKTEWYILSD